MGDYMREIESFSKYPLDKPKCIDCENFTFQKCLINGLRMNPDYCADICPYFKARSASNDKTNNSGGPTWVERIHRGKPEK